MMKRAEVFWLFLLLVFASPARTAEPLSARIDALVRAGWTEAEVTPSERSSDAEFLRRVYLDLAGRIPTSEEARRFLDSREASKRETLVDELLASEDFARHQARRWSLLLMGRGRLPRQASRPDFEAWLEERFRRGAPFDDVVRDVVTASGSPVDNPAANYLLRFEMKPEDVSESVSASFLGIQIGCARCHDHPYEEWTQEDFYGMAAAFGQLGVERPSRADRRTRRAFRRDLEEMQRRQGNRESMTPEERMRMRDEAKDVFDELRSTIRLSDLPRKKLEAEIDGVSRTFSPRFLDASRPSGNPREGLADWMLSPSNPYFARATVNRIWESLFGRGLVDPVDAFGTGNPPSHPELLDVLAKDLIEHGYDVRRTFRLLASSQTYQLSSRYEGEPPEPELFAAARPRRMSPEQLFESLVQVVAEGVPARGREAARFEERKELFFRRFVFLFETDAVDDVEVAQGTIPQALALLNGAVTNRALEGAGRLRRGRGGAAGTSSLPDELYLRAFSRYPTPVERDEMERFLAESGDSARASADALWALVNSSEFILVH